MAVVCEEASVIPGSNILGVLSAGSFPVLTLSPPQTSRVGWGNGVAWGFCEGRPPSLPHHKQLSQRSKILLAEWERLRIQEGLLVREVGELDTMVPAYQLIVPYSQARALWQDYCSAGHSSPEKVLSILRRRFFWSGMAKAVQA